MYQGLISAYFQWLTNSNTTKCCNRKFRHTGLHFSYSFPIRLITKLVICLNKTVKKGKTNLPFFQLSAVDLLRFSNLSQTLWQLLLSCAGFFWKQDLLIPLEVRPPLLGCEDSPEDEEVWLEPGCRLKCKVTCIETSSQCRHHDQDERG